MPKVLTWNLMHGRSIPSAGRDLLPEFAAVLRMWEWDVALLQEVPPWWPARLGAALGAEHRLVLTSRNALLPLRRAIARHAPDLIKSNGGGCNAMLARTGAGAVVEHRLRRLCRWPERRWMHAVRRADGVWIGNLHATCHNEDRARHDSALAAETLLGWARGAPAILGGDFNVRDLSLAGFTRAAIHDVDQVFLSGSLSSMGDARIPDRGRLSDHAPVLIGVELQPAKTGTGGGAAVAQP
ncbi:MAG: endonuclease/exonuclease/phosphatase family protein [Solirubrobacteraceae bacterium]